MIRASGILDLRMRFQPASVIKEMRPRADFLFV